MEALQRIHVFRLFDVFSLLDCLYSLRAGRLQQVCLFLCFKYTNDHLASPGEPLRDTDEIFNNLILSYFRRLLAAAALSRRWSWTRCRLLSLLCWEPNTTKVTPLLLSVIVHLTWGRFTSESPNSKCLSANKHLIRKEDVCAPIMTQLEIELCSLTSCSLTQSFKVLHQSQLCFQQSVNRSSQTVIWLIKIHLI